MQGLRLAAVLCVSGFVALCSVDRTHAAEAYPSRPVRMIIPSTPGGLDQMGRLLAHKYTQAWGQQVVIDNRPGAGMTIGIAIAAKAEPDGYTLLMVNPSHAINATLMPRLPYDPVRDLVPITVVATQANGFVVTPSLPVKSVKDVIALAKAKPRELAYASSGPGSTSHLATELFAGMAGIELTHVPYKAVGVALPDLIAGRVPMMINPMLAVIGHAQAGRLRMLAVTTPKRAAALPDVPTVAEAGVPGYEATAWYMLLAPARTPRALIEQIHAETVKALRSPDVAEALAKGGNEALGNSPTEAADFLRTEIARWGKVIKSANVRIE